MLHILVLHHSFHKWDHGSLWQSYCACFPIWGHCFFSFCFFCAAFFVLAFFLFSWRPFVSSWFSPFFPFCLFFKLSLIFACLLSPSHLNAAFSNPLSRFISARGDYPPQTESSSTTSVSSSGTVRNMLVGTKHFSVQCCQYLLYPKHEVILV